MLQWKAAKIGKHLEVLPVDKISATEGIKLSDLLGKSGTATFSNARTQAHQSLNNTKNITLINDDQFEQNFGLTRKNGHWYLRGRIIYAYRDTNNSSYMDFNVNLIPPAKLIFYDTLCLSWQYIKDRVPDAVECVYISQSKYGPCPNKNKAPSLRNQLGSIGE